MTFTFAPKHDNKTEHLKNIKDLNHKEMLARPFLKWAGGKSQLIDEIRRYYPFIDNKITKYAEPFVGGGAVLFDILNNYNLESVYISDINVELINTYKAIQKYVESVIEELFIIQEQFIPLDNESRKRYYIKKRDQFNKLAIDKNGINIKKASLMIFLNRTCFNGLYRVNKKGQFNVPIGAYKKPLICDEINLRNVAERLQDVNIVCGDYKESSNFIDKNTFVYIDPPYRPLPNTESFTSYTENLFGDTEQIELAHFVDDMDRKGAKIVISNSDPKNCDENDNFFDNIYAAHNIERIEAARMINSNGRARGKIKELLISNYSRGFKNMTSKDFNFWLSNFRNSIANYNYYIDFEKVYRNVDSVKLELNMLNSLIGSDDIENDFERLIETYPEILKCIPLLLAVRSKEIYAVDADGEFTYDFKSENLSPEQYKIFMRKTGLFDLISKHIISNLVDYVTGVEAGLDSNGRKNRGGHLMEDLVESFIKKAGFKKDQDYFKEMYIHQIIDKWGIDLSAISNDGKTEKRFDYVVKTDNMIYGIETNFYGGGGSKLNETARSYKTLALEADTIDGFTFVWFTDGKGWTSARHNLEETFDVMEHIYNIKDMEDGIINKIFK